jgi:predicted Fe-Mo cluster-binding NifX family protein
MELKIAAVTEDGRTLSSHFGMAPYYKVFTIANGQVVAEQQIEKPHHSRHPEPGEAHSHAPGEGHADMFAPIAGCQVLLCGGMGAPAYPKAVDSGLEVVLTGGDISTAVKAYLAGEIRSDERRIHFH